MTSVAARLLPALAYPALAALTATLVLSQPAPAHAAAWEESGQASWYGGRHNGLRTSSGEIFNENNLTAAHPSLPLGSRIRVTMQETGQSVVVRVTDRQPYHGRRIIDLSRGAASQIGLVYRGTGMVTLSPVNANEPLEVAETPGAYEQAAYEDDTVSDAAPRQRGRRHRHRAGRGA